ncbi:MAG: CPXCG motif-containing cysteine-rich protein [Methylobacter sp.]|nr:CPXCG motif-containing cysteine-rich protein [Methylobacter sp.]
MHYQEDISVVCPYCGEFINVLVDTSSGAQEYFEDCSVCCSPILFSVSIDETGEIYLEVKRDDE